MSRKDLPARLAAPSFDSRRPPGVHAQLLTAEKVYQHLTAQATKP